ncbi:MAG: right-handed parallel beta-helix repeat-containing protein [Pseudomonadales bacterium]|nr:right-handed parallel beta-helix repeat-containing protein [Pseudomonadales bacterium]
MKKIRFHTPLSFVLSFFLAGALHAAIINVPADQPTIQAAIDAAGDGDTISVGAGTYPPFSTSFAGPENLIIQAAEGATPVIAGNNDSTISRVVDLRAGGTEFTGFSIHGPGDVAISISGQDVSVHDNSITAALTGIQTTTQFLQGRVEIDNNTVSGATVGISLQNIANEVRGNTLDVTETGIGIGNYKGWRNGGMVDDAFSIAGLGIELGGALVDNRIENNQLTVANGSGVAVEVIPTSNSGLDYLLENNTFNGVVLVRDSGGEQAIFEEDAGPPPADPRWMKRIFTSIQPAVDAAATGHTVVVAAGTYAGNIQIDTPGLTVAGDDGGGVNLDGKITVAAVDVSVSGFSINGSGNDYGIRVDGVAGAEIRDNILTNIGTGFAGNSAQGIYLLGSTNNAVITGNTISGVGSAATSSSNKGIFIGDSVAAPAAGIAISGNTISGVAGGDKGGYGVLVNHQVSGLSVSGNTFSGLSGAWVHAVGLEGNTPNAEIVNNQFSALMADGQDEAAIFFEANPALASVSLPNNRFAADIAFGVAIHPDLQSSSPAMQADASRNYWGALRGPVDGAKAGPGVKVSPWYVDTGLTRLSTAPANLSLQAPPAATLVGQFIAGAPAVQVSDAEGNPVAGVAVTARLSSGGFSGGNATVITAANGLAVFNTLRVAQVGSFTLTFSIPELANLVSGLFVVFALEPVPEPVVAPEPEVPIAGEVEDIVGTIVVPPAESGEGVSAAALEAVDQAATAARGLANTIAGRITEVNTDTAIDALGSIGQVVNVTGNVAANTRATGNATGAVSTASSGGAALSSFSSLLAAIDSNANGTAAPVVLTPVQKTAVQQATIQAVASAVQILTVTSGTTSRKTVLTDLGRIISSNVNLGVALTSTQADALLEAAEQATVPAGDAETQLETSIPIKPQNKGLISRDVLTEALAGSGVSPQEQDDFLMELAQAINPADINVGDLNGEEALSSGFNGALGGAAGSISFDAGTGVIGFTIGAGNVQALRVAQALTLDGQATDKPGAQAISVAERIIPGRVISSNVVAASFPDGIQVRGDGSVIITNQRLASIVVPASFDRINLFADLRNLGVTAVDSSGNLTIDDGGDFHFSGTFDYRGIIVGGTAVTNTTLSPPASGDDESDPAFVYRVTYRDGTRQDIQPFLVEDDFVASIRSRGLSVITNRNNGRITVIGRQFRPSYFVDIHDAQTLAFWNEKKDDSGLAYRAIDINADGIMDFQVISGTTVQVAYGL